MKKAIRILRNIGIVLLVLFLMLVGVYYLIYDHAAYGIVSAYNTNARSHYQMLQSEFASLDQLPNLPEKCVLYGETHDCWDYLVYANDFIPEDTLLCGTMQEPANCYWAVRIENGRIMEVWSANYPLEESQLRPYPHEEQERQIHFPQPFYKSKLIGYYHVTAQDLKREEKLKQKGETS